VKSSWSLADRSRADFYDRNRDLIRDAGHPPHIAAMTALGDGGPAFFMWNSVEDKTSPPAAKKRQRAALAAAGLQAELDLVTPDRIDGKAFKTMDHGMDASLRELFDRCAPRLESRARGLDADRRTVARYDCVDVAYEFTHTDKPPFIGGRVLPLFEALDDTIDEPDAEPSFRQAANG
jgi:hypothetical protein